jgi:putative two-component system response regulator
VKFCIGILDWAGYRNIETVLDPTKALDVFRAFQPDLVVLDLHMPRKDGFRLLEEFREYLSAQSFVPILVFTADDTNGAKKRALTLGASDFLTKPCDADEILLRVNNFLQQRQMQVALAAHNSQLEQRVFERTKELFISRQDTLACLAAAAEYHDDATGMHARRVGDISAAIAASLGLDPATVQLICDAAPLHDIGKIGIADSVLLKPGKLDAQEYEAIKLHTFIGAEILSRGNSPILKLAREIALYHHERWDGGGYLEGLAGDDIPIAARIVSVADAYDAMTSDRPYRAAMSADAALEEVSANSGRQFDPEVVAALLKIARFTGEEGQRAA